MQKYCLSSKIPATRIFSPTVISLGLLSVLKAMGHTTINTSMRYYLVNIEEEDKPLLKKVIEKPNRSETPKLVELTARMNSWLNNVDVVTQ